MEPLEPDQHNSRENENAEEFLGQIRERDERIKSLEEEIRKRDEAKAAARTRQTRTAKFVGEVGTRAIAGTEVTRTAHEAWDAWDDYLDEPGAQTVPKKETRDFLAAVLARLTRVRLIYVLLALVPSVLILWQAILLFQQNERIDRQNNLIAFEQTSNLRELLFILPFDSLGRAVVDYQAIADSQLYGGYPAGGVHGTIHRNPRYIWAQPNESTVEQIVAFARNEPEIVVPALLQLVKDEAPPVAIGALQALGRLRREGIQTDSIRAPEGHFLYADLSFLDLSDADLSGANLSGADLTESDLSGANLTGAYMGDAVLLGTDLSDAILAFTDLRGSFSVATNLQGANLTYSIFAGSTLIKANLSQSLLIKADLSSADLSGADLSGADLSGANLYQVSVAFSPLTIDTNLYCVQNAPNGFVEDAISHGATVNDSVEVSNPFWLSRRACGED